MKRITLTISLLILIFSVTAQQKVKTGFGFGALPAVSYDSDLGFQYGALVNLYRNNTIYVRSGKTLSRNKNYR